MNDTPTPEQMEALYTQLGKSLYKDPPEIPDERLLKALAHHMWSSGRISESITCIRLVEQREVLAPSELNLRGYWQLYLGDGGDAHGTFKAALGQDSSDPASRLGYAYALFYLNEYASAASVFQKLADEGEPLQSPPIMAAACRALAAGGQPEELQMPPLPGLPPGISEIMQMKILHGPAEAIREARARLAQSAPETDRLPMQRLLIELELEDGQESKIIKLIDELLKKYEYDGLLWFFRGITTRRLNQRDTSHESFSAAVLFAPLEPRTWGGYAAGCLERKEIAEAVKAYRIAIFLDNRNPSFWGDLGICELSRKDYSKARDSISKSIEFGTRSFANYFNRGMCSLHLSEPSAAIADWNRAIAAEPNHTRAAEVRGLIADAGGPSTDDRFVFGEIE